MVKTLLMASFPCQWLFVDDELHFLESLSAILPEEQPVGFFNRPGDVLEQYGSLARVKSTSSNQELADLDDISQLITNTDRFKWVSVFVVDYKMPGIDGIALCDSLRHLPGRKILLTGVADEEVATTAFNSGSIDRYIKKSDPDALTKIVDYAQSLTHDFLQDLYPRAFGSHVSDDSVIDFVLNILKQYNIREYYYQENPEGYLCFDSGGRAKFILFESRKTMAQRLVWARSVSAPTEVIADLENFQCSFGVFDEENSESDYDWTNNSIPLEQVSSDLWIGLHSSPPLEVNYNPNQHSFSAQLRESGFQIR